jgi:hypothetical protein
VTFQRFYRCLLIVSLVGSVIAATQVSQAHQLSGAASGQETITGYIQSIDQTTGVITVETTTGVVKLEAAPEAITEWKEGDPVVVKIDRAEQREHSNMTEEDTPLLPSSPTAKSDAVQSH